MSYIGTQPTQLTLETRQEFTASDLQTTFNTNQYTVGYVDCYLNGVKLSTSDFTANNGNQVVLGTGAAAGDILAVVMKKPDHYPLPITDSAGNNVLSESGSVVTLTADAAVIEGSSSGDLVRITQTGSGNALVVEDSTNPDSTPFVVNASGNVGIGTSTPSVKLQSSIASSGVSGVASTAAGLFENSGNADVVIASGASSKSRIAFGDSGDWMVGRIDYDHSDNSMRFGTAGLAERMLIDSSGNVGIGTSNPLAKNHIRGSGTSGQVTASWILENYDSATVGMDIIGLGGSSRWRFLRAGGANGTNAMSEAMCIVTEGGYAGNVGIGVTTPTYQLQLSTDSAGKPSTNTWTIVSDERIKENIELADLDLCYDAVKNIPLKRFKWRDEVYSEEQVADRHKLGWIAQDVETVYPKAVNIHEFKYNQVYNETIIPAVEEELDEDGNIITEAQEERIENELVSEDVIEDCRNLNADQIYAAMYGAIQKLIQKVESQQSTIDALTARIEALETPAE